MSKILENQLKSLGKLLTTMDELREKCPWDKKQTLKSLRHLTIEETYELSDAIINEDMAEIKNELGDLLLHVVFYAKIGSEHGAFDIGDIADGIKDKLISRHPHIYGDVQVIDEVEVRQNWEKLKLKEGNKGVLSGVPNGLPSLVKASRIQDKASGIGFDWKNIDQVKYKISEEIEELYTEIDQDSQEKIEEEFGDVLFSLVNYARFLKINPDDALSRANNKFIRRFEYMEKKAQENDNQLINLNSNELENLWELAKQNLSK